MECARDQPGATRAYVSRELSRSATTSLPYRSHHNKLAAHVVRCGYIFIVVGNNSLFVSLPPLRISFSYASLRCMRWLDWQYSHSSLAAHVMSHESTKKNNPQIGGLSSIDVTVPNVPIILRGFVTFVYLLVLADTTTLSREARLRCSNVV